MPISTVAEGSTSRDKTIARNTQYLGRYKEQYPDEFDRVEKGWEAYLKAKRVNILRQWLLNVVPAILTFAATVTTLVIMAVGAPVAAEILFVIAILSVLIVIVPAVYQHYVYFRERKDMERLKKEDGRTFLAKGLSYYDEYLSHMPKFLDHNKKRIAKVINNKKSLSKKALQKRITDIKDLRLDPTKAKAFCEYLEDKLDEQSLELLLPDCEDLLKALRSNNSTSEKFDKIIGYLENPDNEYVDLWTEILIIHAHYRGDSSQVLLPNLPQTEAGPPLITSIRPKRPSTVAEEFATFRPSCGLK